MSIGKITGPGEAAEEAGKEGEKMDGTRRRGMGWIPDYPDFRDFTDKTEEVRSVLQPAGLLKARSFP